MLLIGHTAIGVGIGLLVPEPTLAFGLAVLSHHIADWIPHFDVGSHYPRELLAPDQMPHAGPLEVLYVTLDLAITLLMLSQFFLHIDPSRWAAVFAAILGAILPDLVHNVPLWNTKLNRFRFIRWWHHQIHGKFQTTVPMNRWYVGVGTQLVAVYWATYLVYYR